MIASAAEPGTSPVSGSISELLERLEPCAREAACPAQAADCGYVLFFSASNGRERAHTVTVRAHSFPSAWKAGADAIARACADARLLRLDWVTQVQQITIGELRRHLEATKRNYFRLGLSLDERFEHAFLETELNGNAMLYGGNRTDHAVLNEQNFARHARIRHGLEEVDFSPERPVWAFATDALFVSAEESDPIRLHGMGRNAGRRVVEQLDVPALDDVIAKGSAYLAGQVAEDGRFAYGVHPCFDRPIRAYNSLRHASTLYAMLEAWEVTRDGALRDSIERAAKLLTEKLIRQVDADGGRLAFLVEANGEIKLGGNGVSLLALVKYSELFETGRYREILDQLASGILFMQDGESGAFTHVLAFPSLEVKEPFRIIYYDGEAAFGLMRLYGLTGERRWLQAVERAFAHFIRERHWKANDHWLGYCVSELVLHRPAEPYFRFGLRNFRRHLDFVLERITTFPTLLELMTSAERLLVRIEESDEHRHLLREVDRESFYRALHFRAHYLLNGHFWPELAMFYARPDKIAGSFFIRHHAFRVRIDDVEHYLSGLIAYRKFLLERGEEHPADRDELEWKPRAETGWNARNVPLATGGNWIVPPPGKWKATGVYTYYKSFVPGRMAMIRPEGGKRGVRPQQLEREAVLPAAAITSDPDGVKVDLPILWVEDPEEAVMDLARYARARFTGRVIGVTGSAGKTTIVEMMARALMPFGLVGRTGDNANLPIGVAWNLASMRWTDPHNVVELSVGRMRQSTSLARPDLAIFTNVLPAHLEHHNSVKEIARRKSRIFLGMKPGAIAVLNRDMEEWKTVRAAAAARKLRIVSYGKSEQCDCRLIGYDASTGEVAARIGGERMVYRLGAQGEHMAVNSLAVIAAASALGHPIGPVLGALETFAPLAGRGAEFETHFGDHEITAIDEAYNANPGSMRAALQLLGGKREARRRVAVLGEMAELGPDAEAYHTALAPLFEENRIDRVHLVGDLYAGLWDALPERLRASRTGSLGDLRRALEDDLADGDCVLFKGSHSTGIHQLVGGLRQA